MYALGRLHSRENRSSMHAVLDIGGGFTKRIEIAEPLPIYRVLSQGPMPKTVSFRLQHYDEANNTAYYKVEEVTNTDRR